MSAGHGPTMRPVDVRLLRTFSAVVRHGSFTGAANALGYTQSAVSQHVAALERSLGVLLFERRPFALTPAARRLAEHAANILLRIDVATSELAGWDRRPVTVVAVSPFAAAAQQVARLLALGRAIEGATAARLHVAPNDAIAAQVADGSCSAGVVDGIVGHSEPLGLADPGLLSALPLRVAPLTVALPADHPLADRARLRWSTLADARWIDASALQPSAGPAAAGLHHRRFARTAYDGQDPSVLATLVAAGHGLALVPAWWRPASPGVRTVVLDDPPLVHRLEVLLLSHRAGEWSSAVQQLHSGQ